MYWPFVLSTSASNNPSPPSDSGKLTTWHDGHRLLMASDTVAATSPDVRQPLYESNAKIIFIAKSLITDAARYVPTNHSSNLSVSTFSNRARSLGIMDWRMRSVMLQSMS